MRTVAVVNHKGGVGKTTFCGSVAQALALSGYRVLVVDNDSQHNLSAMMKTGVRSPNIRDVYRASEKDASTLFLQSVRKTEIPDLHIVTSSNGLCDADVHDLFFLKRVIAGCGLERFYDYVLIDNAPGLSQLQMVAIHAADEIFVPTELRQFAIDGLVEMEEVLRRDYPQAPPISKIIPNFFRDTKRERSFIAALRRLFGTRVTQTAIPLDHVFDELVIEGKILFLHRLRSRGAAFYLKIMHELFDLDEDAVWETMLEKRKQRLGQEARERLFARRRAQAGGPPTNDSQQGIQR
jgi:chromosome partitioning protein